MNETRCAADSPDALGMRLSVLGRRIATLHLVERPWHRPASRLLARASELGQAGSSRFDRVEPGADAGAVPASPARSGRALPAWAPTPTPAQVDLAPGDSGAGRGAPIAPAIGPVAGQGKAPAAGDRPSAPTGVPAATLPPAGSAGRRLPADIRSSLRGIAGAGVDAMLVHDDAAADALARRHGAEAVTVGRHVHLRTGRLRPDTIEGFGLLAHEAAHVSASAGGSSHRASAGGRADEEVAALGVELAARRALRAGRRRSIGDRPTPLDLPATLASAGSPVNGCEPAGPAHGHVMTARSDRDLDAGTEVDLDQLRRSVIDDVMRRLRSEFERGG